MADPDGGKTPAQKSVDAIGNQSEERVMSDGDRRRQFARALTRAEFGRFYWDDKLEAEKQRALRKTK
jgi:hypothetical protein